MGPLFIASCTILNSTIALFHYTPSSEYSFFHLNSCFISLLIIHFLFPEFLSSSALLPVKAHTELLPSPKEIFYKHDFSCDYNYIFIKYSFFISILLILPSLFFSLVFAQKQINSVVNPA